jgi:hypothetical protein
MGAGQVMGWKCKCGVVSKVPVSEEEMRQRRFKAIDDAMQAMGNKCPGCQNKLWMKHGRPVPWPNGYLWVSE